MNNELNSKQNDMKAQSEIDFITYDFKDESIEKYDKTNSLIKFQQYKDAADGFDCDVCLRAITLYKMVFPYVENKDVTLQPERWNKKQLKYQLGNYEDDLFYTGDTLISAQTTLNAFKKLGETSLPKEAMDFMEVVHTVGNFIPSPCAKTGSVNGPRGIGEAKDYSDLYLLGVYNYITDQKLYGWTLERIMGDKNSEVCKRMVEDITSSNMTTMSCEEKWDKFVEMTLLQDSVTKSDEHYSIPKELWEGHFEGSVLPEQYEEFIQFWTNAYDQITRRSRRMKEIINVFAKTI